MCMKEWFCTLYSFMLKNNSNMKKYFALCVMIIFLFSCDYVDDKLVINNKTNDTIVVSFFYGFSDADELHKNSKISKFDLENERVCPPLSMKKNFIKGRWDDYFDIDNDTMCILVFKKEDIIKKGVGKQIKNYKIFKKIKVSLNFMENNNWVINIDSTASNNFIRL